MAVVAGRLRIGNREPPAVIDVSLILRESQKEPGSLTLLKNSNQTKSSFDFKLREVLKHKESRKDLVSNVEALSALDLGAPPPSQCLLASVRGVTSPGAPMPLPLVPAAPDAGTLV